MKILFTILLLFSPIVILSQENDIETVCITNFNTDPDPQGMYSYATTFDPSTALNPPLVLNVKFWVLRRDDGTSVNTIVQNDVLETIANLNINFNQFNIFFKYRGYEYVDNDNAYFETGLTALKNEFEVLELETDS
ncbi:MAG TPA: hypothetical protein DCS66_19485 [Flavobacteriaceae bacterium]|mgnify:FL=1|nr:hypothetical protein [Flavobacteriaceae bacterium]HAT66742.1 hypothetical protein [Flavobacteriaceae bacterium]|tara:strand:+ start:153 stop:560 length:408 start_codon:yes stop_codon:yes gene_type:complete